jgi:hypothetical protein
MIAMKWKAVRGDNGGIVWKWVKVVYPDPVIKIKEVELKELEKVLLDK